MAKAKSDDKAAPNGDTSTKGPSSAQSRRDKLASLETARKKEQRTRTIRLLVICLVLAIGLLAYPVYLFADDYRARNATLEEIGTSIAAAGCDPITTHPATGNQEHVAEGTKVEYAESPPDSGKHYPTPAPFTKHFYAEADRPPVETLVHNLEHGYTVVWYRADAPSKQIKNLQRIAKTFGSDDYDPADAPELLAAVVDAVPGADQYLGVSLGEAQPLPDDYLDISRIKSDIGWKPEYTLEAAIADYARWLQSHDF